MQQPTTPPHKYFRDYQDTKRQKWDGPDPSHHGEDRNNNNSGYFPLPPAQSQQHWSSSPYPPCYGCQGPSTSKISGPESQNAGRAYLQCAGNCRGKDPKFSLFLGWVGEYDGKKKEWKRDPNNNNTNNKRSYAEMGSPQEFQQILAEMKEIREDMKKVLENTTVPPK